MIGGVLYDKEIRKIWCCLDKGSIGSSPSSFSYLQVFLLSKTNMRPVPVDIVKVPEEFC